MKVKEIIRKGLSKQVLAELGIPPRYAGKGLIETNPVHQMALKLIQHGKSLLLTGACGSGKTHLAVALLNWWYAEQLTENREGRIFPLKRGRFVVVPDLLLEIKASWDEKENFRGENEKEIIDRYGFYSFLVLDDLGSETMSEWSRTVISNIINRRYNECKQTIITTNLSTAELAAIDDRIPSRFSEMGQIIDLGKKDWRVNRKP